MLTSSHLEILQLPSTRTTSYLHFSPGSADIQLSGKHSGAWESKLKLSKAVHFELWRTTVKTPVCHVATLSQVKFQLSENRPHVRPKYLGHRTADQQQSQRPRPTSQNSKGAPVNRYLPLRYLNPPAEAHAEAIGIGYSIGCYTHST